MTQSQDHREQSNSADPDQGEAVVVHKGKLEKTPVECPELRARALKAIRDSRSDESPCSA
jgi:hypothetical protein